ncbi:MAG: hypothetical protein AAGA99_27255 [Actinomycetota bacterium]
MNPRLDHPGRRSPVRHDDVWRLKASLPSAAPTPPVRRISRHDMATRLRDIADALESRPPAPLAAQQLDGLAIDLANGWTVISDRAPLVAT